MGTNDTIEELRAYLDDRADADQPAGAAAPIPNEEMRLLQGLDRLAQEHNAYAEMVDRLQSRLDRVLIKAEALQAENERLREDIDFVCSAFENDIRQGFETRDKQFVLYIFKRGAQDTGNHDEWLTHDSHEPPANLAPAQLVWLPSDYFVTEDDPPTLRNRFKDEQKLPVSALNWRPGLRYRPALSASGLPLCSAEGLEPWATHVATDKEGNDKTWQYSQRPVKPGWSETGWHPVAGRWRTAPSTHRRPGPASESLMEVWRD